MYARLAIAVVAALGLIAVGCSSSDDTAGIEIDDGRFFDVEGHRGARGIRPESTLPSFEAALDAGVSTLELDLHLSGDGQLVIWHDAEISSDKCRTEDTTVPDPVTLPMVRSLTAAELARYECDLNPDPKGRLRHQESEPGEVAAGDYSIITLSQLFEFVDQYAGDSQKTDDQRTNAADVQFNLETKRSPQRPETIDDGFDGTNPAEFEQTLAKVIKDWGYESRVIVQSFDHRSLRAFRTIAPDVRLAALTFGDLKPSFRALSESGVSIWSPQYIFASLPADVVIDAQSFGILVIPWTVNSEQNVCAVVAAGGDGLITDRPDMVLGDGGWLAGCLADE